MLNYKFCLSLICVGISLNANLILHNKLAHFVKKQKKTSDRYKNKPLTIISKASWILGYGSVAKDDLYLLDRMPKSEHEINQLVQQYLVDETVSRERLNRWKKKKYKRAAVIQELREYTARQCNCSVDQAYAYMRDQSKIDDSYYFKVALQNLHDLYMFKKTVE